MSQMADPRGKPGGKEEARIPAFTVLKKGSLLKSIFLNNPPPELEPATGSLERSPREPGHEEEKILIGRHPDCHIILDHPSISRFHLEIRVQPSHQKLSVVDLSSVHGTWISGNKIEPHVPLDLVEGDQMKLGASTRVYKLHWVPLSSAFEWDNLLAALPEEQEETQQAENDISAVNYVSFGSWASQIPSAPPMPQSMNSPFSSPMLLAGENLSPGIEALEKLVTTNVPVPKTLSSPFPMEGKEKRAPEAEASSGAKNPSPPNSEKQAVSSNLLSRRSKSKSISFLRVHTGRSRLKLGASDVGDLKENGMVFEQVKGEEALCKVLFSEMQGKVDVGEETYLSGKENMTPEVSCSSIQKKDQKGMQRSTLNIDAALDGKEEVFLSDKENMTPEVSLSHIQKKKQMGLQRSTLNIEAALDVKDDVFLSDKENMTPEVSCSGIQKKQQKGLQRSALNIVAALDGKGELFLSDKVFLSDKENMTPEVSCSGIQKGQQKVLQRSTLNIDAALDGKEELFLSDEKNMTLEVSRGRIQRKDQMGLQRSTLNIDAALDGKEENMTPEASRGGIQKKNQMGLQRSTFNIDAVLDGKEYDTLSDKENITPKVYQSQTQKQHQIASQRSTLNIYAAADGKEEGFNSDKENCTPQVSQAIRQQCIRADDSIKAERQEEDMHASGKENQKPQVSGSKSDPSRNLQRIEREIMKRKVDRIPFQSLIKNSAREHSPSVVGRIPFQPLSERSTSKDPTSGASFSPGNNNVLNHPQKFFHKSNCVSAKQSVNQTHQKVGGTKKWNIVVDTSCFLNEESRKSLQLLEGLRGTHLIIPRMVVRELDCLRRRESYFRRTAKASSALQWIEECMVKTSWWIHVQSSMESMSVEPTPPVSPQVQLCEESNGFHGFISNSMLFSTCGSLAEILSPTAEDHILDCALLFKKIKNDEQLVLLTNEVSLKIKAMAEGLLCESPKEFRESLIHPYSDRFLWAESSPRGPTWFCTDDVGQIENNYNHCPIIRKTTKASEGAKGLKLILLHNSHYAQANLVK